jgi:transposase
MREVFGAMPHCRIALETGMHSPWVSRMLSESEREVIVARARNVRLIGKSRKKDDRLDAQTLARFSSVDPQLLCPVKHRSAKAQADLTVIRARAGLVRARTALVNTVCGLAKSYGERLRGCNVRNMNPEKAERLSPELQAAPEPVLAAIESVSAFVLTLEDPHRFRKSRDLGCISARKAIRICARCWCRERNRFWDHSVRDCDLRRWGLKLAECGGKNGKKRTIIAVARKLAVLLHHLWVSGEVYEALRICKPECAFWIACRSSGVPWFMDLISATRASIAARAVVVRVGSFARSISRMASS